MNPRFAYLVCYGGMAILLLAIVVVSADASTTPSWCKDSNDRFQIKRLDTKKSCKWAAHDLDRCRFEEVKINCPLLCSHCHNIDNPNDFEIDGKKRMKNCQRNYNKMKSKRLNRHCNQYSDVKSNCPKSCEIGVTSKDFCSFGVSEDAIKTAVEEAAFGFVLAPDPSDPSTYNPLIPFSKNIYPHSLAIFDEEKVADYLSGKFKCDPISTNDDLIDTSFEEYTKQLTVKTSIEGSDSNFLSGTMKASAAASFGLTTSQTKDVYYSQRRHRVNFGYTRIPYSDDKSFVQSLMTSDALNKLTSLETLDPAVQNATADSYVASMGVGYLSQIQLGSIFLMTSMVEYQSWMKVEDVETAIQESYSNALLGYSEKTSIDVDVKSSTSSATQHATFQLELHGGDPTLITNETAWLESTKTSPVIINYQLEPIYNLLTEDPSPGSSYTILKGAVHRTVEKFGFDMPDFGYKPIMKLYPVIPSPTAFLPGREGGYDVQVYNPSVLDPNFLSLGDGFRSDLQMATIEVDNFMVKENTDYTLVWVDSGSGWDHDYSIWAPKHTDSQFHPMGFVVMKSHSKPTKKVAMLHSSICVGSEATTSPIYKSTDHIGGHHSIDIYMSLWPNFNGNENWQSNLMKSLANPISGSFDPYPTIMAPDFTKIGLEA